MFESDSKNYHAWSYRIWLIERFELWEGEIPFIENLLNRDVNNNSIWSYRYFIIAKTRGFIAETIKSEVADLIAKRIR